MPWRETRVEEQRAMLVAALERGELTMSELCRELGISRKTGYKWLDRWRREGLEGLRDQSRAPRQHPNQTPAALSEQIVAWRRAHPGHGPVTIRARLSRLSPELPWPAPSTIGALLQREGLVAKQRPGRHRGDGSRTPADEPNRVWSIDYKGWFCLGDGQRCEPLTLLDGYSRFLLACEAVGGVSLAGAQATLATAFSHWGLPEVLRSDNGSPFCGAGQTRLSRLGVWLLRLGVRPEPIAPGCPQQNGRLERLHRTLKGDLLGQPAANLAAQQAVFDAWREDYNLRRPHQGLDLQTPAEVFSPSPRPLPVVLPEPCYPPGYLVRRVRSDGQLKWQGRLVFLGEALVGEQVGLEPLGDPDNRYWQCWFCRRPLLVWDSQRQRWLSSHQAAAVLRPAPAEAALQ